MYKETELKKIFEGKRIMIAGFGREGRSSYKLIRKLFPTSSSGVALAVADKNLNITTDQLLANDTDLSIFVGDDYLAHSAEYDIILKSPGIPTFDFENIVPLQRVSSQTDIFLQIYGSQTVGITGTKGKSTTTNLIYSVLKSTKPDTIMAGNMGLPLFDVVEEINSDTVIVLELSSHQLENIHQGPYIGIVLNLFQEHLDHYHSYLDYKMAKLNIALRQTPRDVFIYCSDNDELAQLADQCDIKSIKLSYSMNNPVDKGCYCDGRYFRMMPGDNIIYDIESQRYVKGVHNLSNCMAVFMVGHCFGIPDQMIVKAISEFKGLEHRLEYVGTKCGITFYNDSISTIPEATIAAVEALKDVDTLILGGFDRGIDYSKLVNFMIGTDVRNIVFVGEAGSRIYNLLKEGNALQGKNYILSNSYPDIVGWCYTNTAEGRICLLSPAASSYDMFKNFEERGRVFKDLVLTTCK